MRELKIIRNRIDRMDEKILSFLNERAKLTQIIGRLKKDSKQAIYSPEREREVLRRLARLNRGPLSAGALEAIYREIMSDSKSASKHLRIAFLGPEFTFTHEAAQKVFGGSVDYAPCASISDVFTEVERDRCDYGVVPVENSTEGAVTYTLDMFIQSDLKMYDEIYLKIGHHLLSRSSSLKSVRNVYSNPQALAQCRNWLEANLPGAHQLSTRSTAEAAEFVAKRSKNRPDDACIASLAAAKEHRLNILARSVEDNSSNTTRFIVISRTQAKPTSNDRTSIVFELQDRIGALHDSLVPFRKAGINLTKIESRPSKKRAWGYYFFVDFDGHSDGVRVRKALSELEKRCAFFKILGSYPKAE